MMRSPWMPVLIAAAVTLLIGVGVAMEPYFAGDVAVARAIQSAFPDPGWWATPISRLAPAPNKYYVLAVTIVAAFFVGGGRGLALMLGFLVLEQYGAEATKAVVARPRPSRDLIAVVGNPSGFTFPSTTITFFAATFGTVGLLAAMRKKAPHRIPVMVVMFGMLALGCLARVALGAHWPSDVVLTTVICLTWIWAAGRIVL
ncbi:MAG TPA: phosphatase PAP2 family protein [Vicinamibacterales bacterium]|nr:phosphatase PAP2 family protein [Vicinamibacterales bacterium]